MSSIPQTEDKGVIDISLSLPWQQGMWVMPNFPMKLYAKYEFNTISGKKIIEVSLQLPQ